MPEFKAGDKVKIEDRQYDSNKWLYDTTGVRRGQILTIVEADCDNIIIKEDKRNTEDFDAGWSPGWFELVKINKKIKISELV